MAIDRRAWCRVETGHAGVRIESKDTLRKAEGPDVTEVLGGGALALVAFILRALGIESGVKVVTQSRVPAGSGLGGLVRPGRHDRRRRQRRRGTGAADGRAVAGGARRRGAGHRGADRACRTTWRPSTAGVLGIAPRAGARWARARLATDPGRVEECLLLVDAGATRFSGINNWEVFKGQIEGDAGVRAALARDRGRRPRACATRWWSTATATCPR